MKEVIATTNAPGAIGPYSQATKAGSLVFVSGQLPIDPATGVMPEDVSAQTKQSLTNGKAIIEAAGGSMADVVKTTVFLADMNDLTRSTLSFSPKAPALPVPPFRSRACPKTQRSKSSSSRISEQITKRSSYEERFCVLPMCSCRQNFRNLPPLRRGRCPHCPKGTIELAEDFQKTGPICRVDVGIDPYGFSEKCAKKDLP